MNREGEFLGKLISDLLKATKQTDSIMSALSSRKQAIQQYYKPRAKFERWRDSTDGQAWKAIKYKQQQGCCAICRCKIELKGSHIDHIRPLSKFPDLAVELSNLQIACPSCNTSKQATVVSE